MVVLAGSADGIERVVVRNDSISIQNNLSFGGFGIGRMLFNKPVDISINKDDQVFVLDSGNRRVQVVDDEGLYLRRWDCAVTKRKSENNFTSIAISPEDGSVYILDREKRTVSKYSENGQYVRSFGERGLKRGKFGEPVDLTVDQNGYIYVLDRHRLKVLKWHENGIFIEEWGPSGNREIDFIDPVSITFNEGYLGRLYVLDRYRQKIISFDTNGKLKEFIDISTVLSNQEVDYIRIEADKEGVLFVLESKQSKLLMLSDKRISIFQMEIGPKGLSMPRGMAVDSNGYIYISDMGKDRVLRFTIQQ